MINVGIVGLGGVGKTHMDNLISMADVKITDICDTNSKNAELAERLGARYYNDLDKMLLCGLAEVIIVCTPTFMHHTQIAAILNAKKHCISEKPLCLSSVDAEELFLLAKANKVYLMVAQVMRFWDEYEALAEVVANGKYGRAVDAYFYRLMESPKWIVDNWLFDKTKSGLQPFDLHIHELDYIVSVFGSPKSFTVQTGCGDKGKGINDYHRVNYLFENLTVCAESSWYPVQMPFTQGFRVYFEQAVVIFDGNTLKAYTSGGEEKMLFNTVNQGIRITTSINVSATNAYYKELEYFLTCVREGREPVRVPQQDVISVLKILEQFYTE